MFCYIYNNLLLTCVKAKTHYYTTSKSCSTILKFNIIVHQNHTVKTQESI